jgi:hypothetical protein
MPKPASQIRPSLHLALQQHLAADASALKADKYELFTAEGSMSPETDLAVCDADAGAFSLALPSVSTAFIGKSYKVRETGGTNDVTLTTPGSEQIDGSNTLTVTAGTTEEVWLIQYADGSVAWISR